MARGERLDGANLTTRGLWWLEAKLQRFLQVGESLFFGLALASDVEFEALETC
jgi:hypothetical protein